jgi:hypothetical protein
MARHIVMDPSGHSTFQFSPRSLADLANAERRFKKLLTKGYVPAYPEGGAHTAFRRKANDRSTRQPRKRSSSRR